MKFHFRPYNEVLDLDGAAATVVETTVEVIILVFCELLEGAKASPPLAANAITTARVAKILESDIIIVSLFVFCEN